jgi:hypothetical protein
LHTHETLISLTVIVDLPNIVRGLDCTALQKLEKKVEIIRLLGLFGHTIHVTDPTPPTTKNNLVSLFPHTQAERIHQAMTRIAPITRQNIHMLRTQAKGTMIPITPVGHGLDYLLTMLTTKSCVFCNSTHPLFSLSWVYPKSKEPGGTFVLPRRDPGLREPEADSPPFL